MEERGRSGLNQILQTLLWSPVGLSPRLAVSTLNLARGYQTSEALKSASQTHSLPRERTQGPEREEGCIREVLEKREQVPSSMRYSVECVWGAGEGPLQATSAPASLQWVLCSPPRCPAQSQFPLRTYQEARG